MFPVQRRYKVQLTGSGGPGPTVDVPWTSEEPVQNLCAVIACADMASALPTGSAQVVRAGAALGSPIAFAGSSMVLPLFPATLADGSDDLGVMHPKNANPENYDGVFAYSATAGGVVKDAAQKAAIGKTGRPLPTAVRITNTSAAAIELDVILIGLAWRNT